MKTALYQKHCDLGARMVSFHDWEMPLQYKGIIHEHGVVREHVGIFDVSHMGRIDISGPDAEAFLDYLATSTILGKPSGTAIYTTWCKEDGGCVDDGIVYKVSPTEFFVIVNAGNRQSDLDHFRKYAGRFKVNINPQYEGHGILALQGPKTCVVLKKAFNDITLTPKMHFAKMAYEGAEIIVSHTGYTGEGGCEILGPSKAIVKLWDLFLKVGQTEGLEPIGLGARDTLRLEMGYALYGHELSAAIAPIESVAHWTVKMEKPTFLGKEALQSGSFTRHAFGAIIDDKVIARGGDRVVMDGQEIGTITSGGFSPSLQSSIALLLSDIPLRIGQQIEINVRRNLRPAHIVELPFYKHKG